jgi:hypothetical protein
MKEKPLVSVCIVVQDNYESTIFCIDNLIAKAGAPFELCIIDNGSTDKRVSEYCKSVTSNYIGIEQPMYLCKVNNWLIEQCTTEFMVIFTSDFVVGDLWLLDLLYAANNFNDSGLVGIKKVGDSSLFLSPRLINDEFSTVWCNKNNVVSGVFIARTELLRRVHGYNNQLVAPGFEQDELSIRVRAIGMNNFYIRKQICVRTLYISENMNPKKTSESKIKFLESINEHYEKEVINGYFQ